MTATASSLRAGIAGLVLCALPTALSAGGIYVPMKGAKATGLANVGMASLADDGSTLFYNPAGMTRLGRPFAELGLDLISARIGVDDAGSQAVTPGTAGIGGPVAGGSGDNTGWTPAPSLFLGAPIGLDGLWLGLAVTAPYGLGIDYGRSWFGRYDSYDNELTTLNVAPTVAYRISPRWSVGGGVDLQYADATLISALPDPLSPGGPSPATDGRSELSGDGWAAGFNLGLLFEPNAATRIGLHYRSEIAHTLDGELEVSGLRGPLEPANGKRRSKTRLQLPARVALSATHAITDRWTVLGEVQWFGWDVFDEIRVQFDDGGTDLVRPQGWRQAWTSGVGVQYAPTDRWQLRAGIQYDQSPTTDALRNTSIPDSDLLWLGLGASYRPSERLSVDIGYVRGRFAREQIDLQLPFYDGTPLATSVLVRGETDSHVDTLSLTLNYRFGD